MVPRTGTRKEGQVGGWTDTISNTGQDTVEEVVNWGAQAPSGS